MQRSNRIQILPKLAALIIWAVAALTPCACAHQPELESAAEPADADTQIWYVTVRDKIAQDDSSEFYGDLRGSLRSGVGTVHFNPIWGLQKIAESAAFYIPDERIKVSGVTEMPEEQFWKDIAAFTEAGGQLVCYVHGYNIGFEKGLRQAAIFQRALDPGRRLILFSWPADGDLLKYTRDMADLEWSVPRLADMLEKIVARTGKGKLDVAAHSLGARGVVEALYVISRDAPGGPLLNNLILMAPDIDSDRFRDAWPDVKKLAFKTTLYVSENDTALKLSRKVNGYPRLGEAGEYLTVLPGTETIDVSMLQKRSASGHVYHLYNPEVVADLAMLVNTGRPAGERPNLEKDFLKDIAYWRLMPEETENP